MPGRNATGPYGPGPNGQGPMTGGGRGNCGGRGQGRQGRGGRRQGYGFGGGRGRGQQYGFRNANWDQPLDQPLQATNEAPELRDLASHHENALTEIKQRLDDLEKDSTTGDDS